MKAIPYGKQSVTEDDIQAVIDVLKSNFWTQGPKVKECIRLIFNILLKVRSY